MEPKIRTERNISDYSNFNELRDHIYARPTMYIGNMEPYSRPEWIYHQGKLVEYIVDICDGVTRTVLEILSNAGDNVISSRKFKVNPGDIRMWMDSQRVTIRSGGESIPVVPKPELSTPDKCMTLVDQIFGTLLTSSHYDDTVARIGVGQNGYGAKLCNVFSKHFEVRVGDPRRGIEHVSIWSNNMRNHDVSTSDPPFVYHDNEWVSMGDLNPKLKYTGEAYVQVSWILDFAKFNIAGYTEEVTGLYTRFLIDFSLTIKVNVYFNDERINVCAIKDYANLIFTPDQVKTAITHYEFKTVPDNLKGMKPTTIDRMVAECLTDEWVPTIEVCLLDTPFEQRVFSYVNGMITVDGGVHVEEVYKVVSKVVLEQLNNKLKGEKKVKLTMADVKPHVSMIVNYQTINPGYKSQSKTCLTGPKPKLSIPDLDRMFKWQLMDQLLATLEAKTMRKFAKTDGKKRRHIALEKGEDANLAGSKESEKCSLILVEGKSASAYPRKWIALKTKGKDFFGYFPLRGKPLNVSNVEKTKIYDNVEINEIKKLMGFVSGADYTLPVNRKQLRYGFILATTDADDDGKHILMLLINFLYKCFPSILQIGIFGFLATPVVRVFKGSQIMYRFYNTRDFERWLQANPHHRYKVEYYKGLGSSTDEDIADDLTTAPVIQCVYDDLASSSLDLAFDRKNTHQRKQWIQTWRERVGVEDVMFVQLSALLQQRTVTSIVNYELIDYSTSVLFRAINSFKDGLKRSQRQALWYVLETWKYGRAKKEPMKLSQIANAASHKTHYHHGEKSLIETFNGMTQDFIGSNNLNFFMPKGQFGTRSAGGEDCADGRYTKTCPEWWLKYVYSEEMVHLQQQRNVEGDLVEPVILPCDIPVHVINGACGVATGHSNYIPPHNPIAVVKWLLEKNRGGNPIAPAPWFRGFTGKVRIVKKRKRIQEEKLAELEAAEKAEAAGKAAAAEAVEMKDPLNAIDDDALNAIEKEDLIALDAIEAMGDSGEMNFASTLRLYEATGAHSRGVSVLTQGAFQAKPNRKGGYDIEITELPVGRWMDGYRKWLEKLREDKKITDVVDHCTTEKVNYTITGYKSEHNPSVKDLKLLKRFGMSNMTLIDDDGYPFHFEDIQQALEVYHKVMVDLYQNLIDARIKKFEQTLVDLRNKLKLITLVTEEQIIVFKRNKPDILSQMRKHEIPEDTLTGIGLGDTGSEKIAELEEKINDMLQTLEGTRQLKPTQVWSERLVKFLKELEKRYK